MICRKIKNVSVTFSDFVKQDYNNWKHVNIISKIQKHLSFEMSMMDSQISKSLNVPEELISNICTHLISSGGKRIRPLLTILTSKMFGYSGTAHIQLATAIEFIHTATLLHDDVVDESSVRRNKPTANVIWGNKASILVGDFLFTQAFQLIVGAGSIPAMETISEAAKIVSQGEVSQLSKLKQKRMITKEEYHQIIDAKTASLFGAACEVGPIITNQSEKVRKAVKDYGINLGITFQIIDDLLDYLGTNSEIGKNIGDDFLEGKVTIPLILLCEKLLKESLTDASQINQMLLNKDRSEEDFIYVKSLMLKFDIQQDVLKYLEMTIKNAKISLQQMQISNIYTDYLLEMIDFTVVRSN